MYSFASDSEIADHYRGLLRSAERGDRNPVFRSAAPPDFDPLQASLKFIAYYLPQYHPIRENDEWWGKGFTEWTNVTRALPQFIDHYQPRLPSDLGFYDLRLAENLKAQANLAKMYGISGFCFHHYWFSGRRVLERPLDLFLESKEIDFEFCLCWANENWTRRWDGEEADILLRQEHTPETDERFIHDIVRFLSDRRYIKVNGKPLLIVYRASLLPDIAATAKRWQTIARKALGTDLYLVSAITFDNTKDPRTYGFDAAVQFPPHHINMVADHIDMERFVADVKISNPSFSGRVYEYGWIPATAGKQLESFGFPVIPAVFPSWDNTARRGSACHCFHGSKPEHYQSWLAEAALFAAQKPVSGSSLVFINAWNEWAEGAYLEPDQRFGHAYLRATAEVLRPYSPACPTAGKITPLFEIGKNDKPRRLNEPALLIHAFYPEPLEAMLATLSGNTTADMFISVAEGSTGRVLPIIARHAPGANVYVFENRGRDVRPFLKLMSVIKYLGYEYFIKMHTKRSVKRSDGDKWFKGLTAPLYELAKPGVLREVFAEHPRAAMIGAAGHILDGGLFRGSAANLAWLRRLCLELDICTSTSTFQFVAGTMFAGRVNSFQSIMSFEQTGLQFEEEQGHLDGTLAHALERFFGLLPASKGETILSAAVVEGKLSVSSDPGKRDPIHQHHGRDASRDAEIAQKAKLMRHVPAALAQAAWQSAYTGARLYPESRGMRIVTAPQPWSYAATLTIDTSAFEADDFLVEIEAEVRTGVAYVTLATIDLSTVGEQIRVEPSKSGTSVVHLTGFRADGRSQILIRNGDRAETTELLIVAARCLQ